MTSTHDTGPARAAWRPVLVAWGVAVVAVTVLAWLVDAVREREGLTTRDSGVLVHLARWVTDLASLARAAVPCPRWSGSSSTVARSRPTCAD
ncbi:MAG: hypothetical protein WDA60_18115, partial [Acidimicrobiia bacterium]